MSTVIPDEAAHAHGLDDEAYDDSVEIHRDGPLSGVIGVVAAALAVGYLLRATGSGSPLDWALCVATGAIGALYLATLVDSRAPLMVIDHHGVRVRRGPTWQGVSWPEVERVEHRPRSSMLRDGSLTVVDFGGRRLGVRLSLSTRLVGADWHELTGALGELTDGRAAVVEVVAPVRERPVPVAEPVAAESVESVEVVEPVESVEVVEPVVVEPEAAEPTVVVEPTPTPERDLVAGRRTDVLLERATSDDDTSVIMLPAPSSPVGESETSTIYLEAGLPDAAEVPEPVVGVVLAAARTRLGLSVDQLADRTRIRPHVIEAIEVDQFESCGGDFYARGHLHTLARVLGVEAAPLLEAYDERYADAPIDARRVFEAELATSAGGVRGAGGGLNWSVLVAVVMAVVLVWSVTRLVMDGPNPTSVQPVLNGSPNNSKGSLAGSTTSTAVPVSLTAVTGGARVIVRDGKQQVVFDQQLAFMQTAELDVVPPVRISSTDGGLQVSVDDVDQGALGATGKKAQETFVP